MTLSPVLAVASGGALGALARWGVARGAAGLGAEGFWATAGVNVAGSFGLGLAASLLAGRSGALPLFLLVGFFGAFTTFSTFAMDAAWLMRERGFGGAGVYVAASVVLALAAFLTGAWAGQALGRGA